jgi:hypothetical protein
MRIYTHIIFAMLSGSLLAGCVTVEIPIGDAIDSTKDWINEERDRKTQNNAAQQDKPG